MIRKTCFFAIILGDISKDYVHGYYDCIASWQPNDGLAAFVASHGQVNSTQLSANVFVSFIRCSTLANYVSYNNSGDDKVESLFIAIASICNAPLNQNNILNKIPIGLDFIHSCSANFLFVMQNYKLQVEVKAETVFFPYLYSKSTINTFFVTGPCTL